MSPSDDPHAAYMAALPAPARVALVALAGRVAARLPPGALPVMSYGSPAWRVPVGPDATGGRATRLVAGVAGLRRHIGFYPHSGGIVAQLAERLTAEGIAHSRGAITTPFDRALPDWVLDEVIRLRLAEIAQA